MRTVTVIAAFAVTLLSLASGGAYASEAGGHGSAMDWVWKFVNFAILVTVLVIAFRKPMAAYFRNRTQLIEKSIRESAEAKAMAEQALKEVEEKLRLKDQEIERIIQASAKSGEFDREALIQDGEKMSGKIIEQARTNIEYELKKAKEQLKSDAARLAIEIAEKKLSQKLSEEEQLRILEESLRKLEGKQ